MMKLSDVSLTPTNINAGSVVYAEIGEDAVEKLHAVKIIKFGAPLFFANVGVLKVSALIFEIGCRLLLLYHQYHMCKACKLISLQFCLPF